MMTMPRQALTRKIARDIIESDRASCVAVNNPYKPAVECDHGGHFFFGAIAAKSNKNSRICLTHL